MKKLLSMLLAFLMLVSLASVASAEETEAGNDVSWTVFVYLCGADLESEYGLATGNMAQMVDASEVSDVCFVVQTGGAKAWQSQVSPDAIQRYVIYDGEVYLADSQPLASMGDPSTLTAFLQWGLSNFPSDHTGLVLWDHGGGSITGVCFDELDDDRSLSLTDIETSLRAVSSLIPNGFEMIGFDACLMGTVETAAILAPFARYLVASEEVVPGSGWNYAGIGEYLATDPDADGASLGRAVCDSFYQSTVEDDDSDSATMSVIDLGAIPALRTAFDAYAKDLYTDLEQGLDYAPVARSINAADNFGGNNRSEGYTNMVDMGGLIEAGRQWSQNADAALQSLHDAVLYQVKGADHSLASGLALYYPLCVQGSEELSIFKDICVSAYYLGLVDKVAYGYANGGDMDNYGDESSVATSLDQWSQSGDTSDEAYDQTFGNSDWSYLDDVGQSYRSDAITFTAPPSLDENGVYTFTLDENGIRNTERVDALVYLVSADGSENYCLGLSGDVVGDWDTGTFTDNFDGTWFSLPDGQPLCAYLVDQCDGYDLYTSPIMLNGNQTNLRFRWDYDTGAVTITDIWDGVDSAGFSGRPTVTLKPGDVITPLYDSYDYTNESFYASGTPFSYTGDNGLVFGALPEGEYLYSFWIDDIYGGSWMSDTVSFSIQNGSVMYNLAA